LLIRYKKANSKAKLQSRTLIITEQAIYIIGGLFGITNKVTRRTLIKSISTISLSTLADSYVIIHCTGEPDYLIESEKKTEIVAVIFSLYKDLNAGSTIRVDFNDNIPFQADVKTKKEIKFSKDDTLKKTSFKINKDIIQILTLTGLPKDSGASRKKHMFHKLKNQEKLNVQELLKECKSLVKPEHSMIILLKMQENYHSNKVKL